MFAILSRHRGKNKEADKAYAVCLSQARLPVFYTDFAVPDTFDGRFEMLVLHCILLINASNDPAFHQNVFDSLFKDMDQTLREMGIGDMGVPKRMRKMMTGFNGRLQAYQDNALKAITTNVYGTSVDPNQTRITDLHIYYEQSLQYLKSVSMDDMTAGQFSFAKPHEILNKGETL